MASVYDESRMTKNERRMDNHVSPITNDCISNLKFKIHNLKSFLQLSSIVLRLSSFVCLSSSFVCRLRSSPHRPLCSLFGCRSFSASDRILSRSSSPLAPHPFVPSGISGRKLSYSE